MTRDDASISFVPPDRYGFMDEAACQYRMFRWPSRPRWAWAVDDTIAVTASAAIRVVMIFIFSSFLCGRSWVEGGQEAELGLESRSPLGMPMLRLLYSAK